MLEVQSRAPNNGGCPQNDVEVMFGAEGQLYAAKQFFDRRPRASAHDPQQPVVNLRQAAPWKRERSFAHRRPTHAPGLPLVNGGFSDRWLDSVGRLQAGSLLPPPRMSHPLSPRPQRRCRMAQ